ncbi:hypothetical protein KJ903_03035 [Patescibacteria group bacterium]|nr:hypothetical protein [Patescibacteria group bacterium]
MPASTTAEVKRFVEGSGRDSLVAIRNEMGGRCCEVLGRVKLWFSEVGTPKVGFRWIQRVVASHLEDVLVDGNFYIYPCAKNRKVQVVFLRVGSDTYNLCPLRCHQKKGCGQ